jgi:hypothetical protein
LGLSLQLNLNRVMNPEDFTHNESVPFPAKGSCEEGPYITPPHKLVHTFTFKTYAPAIFCKFREFFNVDVAAYEQSVCGKWESRNYYYYNIDCNFFFFEGDYNYVEFISNSKSGQFFFYSHDGRYMLKTQTKEENKFLLTILPQYYEYLRENPHSFLVRILGMHRITMYHLRRKVHFVIMASVFDTPSPIHKIYDLKGSMIGRLASEMERENGGVLKDADLLQDQLKIHLGKKKMSFIIQLKKDAEFLASLNIMDYSLLLGVHYRSKRNDSGAQNVVPGSNHSSVSQPSIQHQQQHQQQVVSSVSAAGNALHTVSTATAAAASTTTTAGGGGGHLSGGSSHGGSLQHSNLPFRRASLNTAATEELLADGGGGIETTGTISTPRRAAGQRRSLKVIESPASVRQTNFLTSSQSEYGTMATASAVSTSNHLRGEEESNGHRIDELESETNRSANRILFPETTIPSEDPSTTIIHSEAAASHSSREGFETELLLTTRFSAITQEEDGEIGEEEEELEEEEGEEDEFEDIDEGDSDLESTIQLGKSIPNLLKIRPWTNRVDLGINSSSRNGRGDEIYYVGVIDILQQYNMQKRFETMMKVSQLTMSIIVIMNDLYMYRDYQQMY